MSHPDNTVPARNGGVKTLAIRLEPELHSQLTLLAQLQGSTITDEIRTAIEDRIAVLRAKPDLVAKADTALADIERDAALRRSTIAALFGGETSAVEPPNKQSDSPTSRTRGRKSTEGGASSA